MRKDARQGTIDQDPDFIAFLESLTQPLSKPAPVDSAENDDKKEIVTTTPLVQYIKDKKASKAKDGSASKSSKRADKESKQEKVQAKKLLQRPDKEAAASSSDRKTKGDKPSKESGKAAKQAAAATKAGKQNASNASKDVSTSATERKKERGNVTAATKILQRDLGLSPSPSPSGGRRRGKGGSTETGSPKAEGSRDSSVAAAETTSKPPKGTAARSNSNKTNDTESKRSDAATATTTNVLPAKPPKADKSKPAPPSKPTPGSTQAFLKHANPSQGVTEALLTAAFAPFGALTKVEMDKKKGFAYVDFVESESLQKAMAASPVAVGQSQVVVLERKANPGGEKSRKARGDSQQAKELKDGKAKTSESNASGTGTGTGTTGSSRGSRGGRGGRKGKGEGGKSEGPKIAGTGAGIGAGAQEKTGSEAK